jgi:hypothetical protein
VEGKGIGPGSTSTRPIKQKENNHPVDAKGQDMSQTTREIAKLDVDMLWRRHEILVKLHERYLDKTIKVNAFHLAITAGFLAVCLKENIGRAKWALLLPLGYSVGLAAFFVTAFVMLQPTRQSASDLRRQIGCDTASEFRTLGAALLIFALIDACTAAGLIWFLTKS